MKFTAVPYACVVSEPSGLAKVVVVAVSRPGSSTLEPAWNPCGTLPGVTQVLPRMGDGCCAANRAAFVVAASVALGAAVPELFVDPEEFVDGFELLKRLECSVETPPARTLIARTTTKSNRRCGARPYSFDLGSAIPPSFLSAFHHRCQPMRLPRAPCLQHAVGWPELYRGRAGFVKHLHARLCQRANRTELISADRARPDKRRSSLRQRLASASPVSLRSAQLHRAVTQAAPTRRQLSQGSKQSLGTE